MIIFLNGASSSGKTTVAKALQHLYPTPLLLLGIDTFFNMLPSEYVGFGPKSNEGFQFINETQSGKNIVAVKTGFYGQKLENSSAKLINLLADDGHNIILDEVILEKESLIKYCHSQLSLQTVYFIGIKCDIATIEEREILRDDRALGLGHAQFQIVHNSAYKYDLVIDTTSNSAFKCAKEILDFIDKNPN